jgi:hypothetical protein
VQVSNVGVAKSIGIGKKTCFFFVGQRKFLGVAPE